MANRDREPPGITLTTTTSRPQTTTHTYTIGGRRNRNRDSHASDETHLRATTPTYETPEPFPALPEPTPDLRTTRSNQDYFSQATPVSRARTHQDYFSQPPQHYQIRSRPIGIRRLPSANTVEQTGSKRPHDDSTLTRRRTNTGPSQRPPPEAATSSLAGLPGHYDVGNNNVGMETIGEDQEAHHGQHRDSTGGSTKLRRLSNAASTTARSIVSKLSDDPAEDKLRRRNTRDYEGDIVDYLDVLGESIGFLSSFVAC